MSTVLISHFGGRAAGWNEERVRLTDATVERKGREGRKEILSYFAPFATSAFDRDVL